MLLGTLGASLLGNVLTGKGANRARDEIIWTYYECEGSLIKIWSKSIFATLPFNWFRNTKPVSMRLDLMAFILVII